MELKGNWRAGAEAPRAGLRLAVLPGIVLLFGLAATALATHLVKENVRVKNRQHFQEQIYQVERTIAARMEAYVGLLRAGAGLFAAQPHLSLKQFRDFHQRLKIDKNYTGIQGYGFSKRFGPEGLADVVARQRAEGMTNFTVWPERPRAEYHSILYLEPLEVRNRRALGYDMATEDIRRAAMDAARDRGDAALTGKVRLVQEGTDADQPGFLIYVPVYEGGDVPAALEDRRRKLLGYVYAPFRAGDLFDAMLAGQFQRALRFSIWDGSNPAPEHLLYQTPGYEPSAGTELRAVQAAGAERRSWTIGYQPVQPLDEGSGHLLIVPVLGAMASLLLSYLTWTEGQGREKLRVLNQELEGRVRARTAALLESKDQMEAFTYTMAHDLRAPLRAMQGFSQALRDDYQAVLDETARDYLTRVMSSAQKMDSLIQDLLAYSQLSRSDLSFSTVPLQDVVERVLATQDEAVRKTGAEVEKAVPPLAVRAHGATLEHAISNLVGNALKFVRPGDRPRLRIAVAERDQFVRLTVADNGIGVAPEHQDRIFRVFERLHSEREYSGTGIGLAIVKKGIERMGGRVGVESAPGRGSSFWIELPAASARPLGRDDFSAN